MLSFSNLVGVDASPTFAATDAARARRSRGLAVVDLGIGEPVLDPDPVVREAGVRAIRDGATRYTAVAGIPPLREAIARLTSALDRVDTAPHQVVATAGAKQALFNTCFVLFGPGDEVLVPTPAWPSYAPMLRIAGATAIPVAGHVERDWKVTVDDLAASTTPRTRGLVLNSPCNPTGAVYDADELHRIATFAAERGWWVVADEIYRHIAYGEPAAAARTAGGDLARTVVVGGVAKDLCMTGWRLGWVVAPPGVAGAIETLQSHTTAHPCTISQHAALAALADPATHARLVGATRAALRRRRDVACRTLAAVGARFVRPDGAFYLFVACDAPGDGVARALLEERGVAVVPGTAFGQEGWLRASYGAADDDVAAGFAAVADHLAGRVGRAAAAATGA